MGRESSGRKPYRKVQKRKVASKEKEEPGHHKKKKRNCKKKRKEKCQPRVPVPKKGAMLGTREK